MASNTDQQDEHKIEEYTEEDTTGTGTGTDLVATSNNNNNNTRTATVDMSTLPLDWTQLANNPDGTPAQPPPMRFPHDVAEISPEDLDICVVGTAGQKITHLNNDFSRQCNPQLETLVLRSHLLTKMTGLDGLTQLRVLEFYDNQIQELASLEGPGPNLITLDMSYNSIRDMSPVATCVHLQELYLANNKLKAISGLSALKHLRKVDLGANRIRVMDAEQLAGLENLEELWLGKNKIEEITGLETLTKLRRLDVQSNRLTKVENLMAQKDTLEELYLAHNGIDNEGASCETGLALTFPNLNVLDLSRNRLTSTKPFAHLPGLEELWLSGNQVETMDAVEPLRQAAAENVQSLETIYLEYNPVASEFEYRKMLKEWIPSLQQIDADRIQTFTVAANAEVDQPRSILHPASIMTPEQMQQAALERARQQQNES
eukprot:Nitzschia sp. Nitz4//scaffold180_size44305//2689//4167//NITZ4_007232-RA/size44305-processed-gene-0.8-mRNA-1//1//CDS//3329539446//857//frame0